MVKWYYTFNDDNLTQLAETETTKSLKDSETKESPTEAILTLDHDTSKLKDLDKPLDIITLSHTDTHVESIVIASLSDGPYKTKHDTLPLVAPHTRQVQTSPPKHKRQKMGCLRPLQVIQSPKRLFQSCSWRRSSCWPVQCSPGPGRRPPFFLASIPCCSQWPWTRGSG